MASNPPSGAWTPGRHIFDLPDEMLVRITSCLRNRYIKITRLVSRRVRDCSVLNFDRVLISPNHKNLEVFQAIADHPKFCKQVKEIVWDDAILGPWGGEDDDLVPEPQFYRCKVDDSHAGGIQFLTERIEVSGSGEEDDGDHAESEHYVEYRRLFLEQQQIIAASLDAVALRVSLPKFPALKRVTVTPATYSSLERSSYLETPLMRSFPDGFCFPKPSGWQRSSNEVAETVSWSDIRDTWHGLTVVLSELAHCKRSVPELVLDVRNEPCGVYYHLIQEPSQDRTNLESICRRGLRRFDLALSVAHVQIPLEQHDLYWSALRQMLGLATELESFTIHADVFLSERNVDRSDVDMSLLAAVPVETWPALRHLGVSHLPLTYDELLTFLSEKLPSTIESVEIVHLQGLPQPRWRELLHEIRDKLKWTGNKPKLSLTFASPESPSPVFQATDTVADFLDGTGENPFSADTPLLEDMQIIVLGLLGNLSEDDHYDTDTPSPA